MTPTYSYVCLSCGQVWGPEGCGKHTDPETGEKCRDVTGDAALPVKSSETTVRLRLEAAYLRAFGDE